MIGAAHSFVLGVDEGRARFAALVVCLSPEEGGHSVKCGICLVDDTEIMGSQTNISHHLTSLKGTSY
jgi:hypothetical protein